MPWTTRTTVRYSVGLAPKRELDAWHDGGVPGRRRPFCSGIVRAGNAAGSLAVILR